VITALALVRFAWKRNKYDDRAGFPEIDADGYPVRATPPSSSA